MTNIILVVQIVLAALLVGLVLVQSKGSGLGRAWGGGRGTSFTRRGFEKLLFRLTFFVVGVFIIVSILTLAI